MRVKRFDRRPRVFACTHHTRSSAFTLFEVLLVIGMLSLLMAMAWPAYDRMMEARRLTDGASQVRTLFRQARRNAIADGLVYRCDFLPETPRVRAVPQSDSLESDSTTAESAPASSASTDEFEPERIEEELPDGLRVILQEEFDKGPPEIEEGLAGPEQATPASDESADPASPSSTWMPLAQFTPDGSAEDVTIWLVDKANRSVSLRVLSLTGEVEIGEVEDWLTQSQREEIEQANAERATLEGATP